MATLHVLYLVVIWFVSFVQAIWIYIYIFFYLLYNILVPTMYCFFYPLLWNEFLLDSSQANSLMVQECNILDLFLNGLEWDIICQYWQNIRWACKFTPETVCSLLHLCFSLVFLNASISTQYPSRTVKVQMSLFSLMHLGLGFILVVVIVFIALDTVFKVL